MTSTQKQRIIKLATQALYARRNGNIKREQMNYYYLKMKEGVK